MDPFIARFSKSLLAVNEWMRRYPPEAMHDVVLEVPAVPDAWADFILQARIYIEHAEGRPLILFRLIQDIAPELMSRATALRYVRHLERRGLIRVESQGRHQVIAPTELLLESWRGRVRTIRSILDGFGIVDRPMHRETLVLYLSANGTVRDAWNTMPHLGYAPAELVGKPVGMLIPFAPQDTRDLIDEVQRMALRGQLVQRMLPLATKAGQSLDADLRAFMERTSTGTDLLRAEFLIHEHEP